MDKPKKSSKNQTPKTLTNKQKTKQYLHQLQAPKKQTKNQKLQSLTLACLVWSYPRRSKSLGVQSLTPSSTSSNSSTPMTNGVVSSAPSPAVSGSDMARTPRTTSPLQMGHVRRRVVSHGVLARGMNVSVVQLIVGIGGRGKPYMQPTWNSWPHGSFITRLTPSTYSSRHTTHSLQPLHRRWNARPMFRAAKSVLLR